MITILLVDDDSEKLGKILTSISKKNNLSTDQIDFAEDINTAKKKMQSRYYDLLILDIALPNRINEKVNKYGGLDLLEELYRRKNVYKIPLQIIGLTQYKNILTDVRNRFDKMSIISIYYDKTSKDWLETLNFTIKKAIDQKSTYLNYYSDYQSFLSITCALDNPELNALLNNGWSWSKRTLNGDHTVYYMSDIKKAGKSFTVFTACAPRMGMPACAVTASKMIFNFKPQYIAICGITAGYSKEIGIGDIIVADPA